MTYVHRRVHKKRKRRLNDGEQRYRDKGTDGTQARHQHTSNRMANQQHANSGHSMPMTSSGSGTTSPRMMPSQATTSFSTGGVYETIPAQQGDIPSVYARMNQPTEATGQSVYYTRLDRPAGATNPSVYARVDRPLEAATPSVNYARLDRPAEAATPSVFYARLDRPAEATQPSQ